MDELLWDEEARPWGPGRGTPRARHQACRPRTAALPSRAWQRALRPRAPAPSPQPPAALPPHPQGGAYFNSEAGDASILLRMKVRGAGAAREGSARQLCSRCLRRGAGRAGPQPPIDGPPRPEARPLSQANPHQSIQTGGLRRRGARGLLRRPHQPVAPGGAVRHRGGARRGGAEQGGAGVRPQQRTQAGTQRAAPHVLERHRPRLCLPLRLACAPCRRARAGRSARKSAPPPLQTGWQRCPSRCR